jgi:hypothetical protein
VQRVVGAVVLIGMICLGGMVTGWMTRVRPTSVRQDGLDTLTVTLPDSAKNSASRTARIPATPPSSFVSDPLAFLSNAPGDSLDLLPGIGPVLAARIIAVRRVRPFTSWADVDAVKGVGPKLLARWQALSTRQ